jgi:hypothetical protein
MLAAAKLRGDEMTEAFHLVMSPSPHHAAAQARYYLPDAQGPPLPPLYLKFPWVNSGIA